MSKQDTGQQEDTGQQDDGNVERYESGQIAEKPEPTDEQKKRAAEMSKSYAEDRPTTVLPGSGNTVTGKAVNDWVDDDGNPVHGEVSEERQEAADRDREINERAKTPVDDDS